MIKVLKVDKKDLPTQVSNEVMRHDQYEYYEVMKSDQYLGYFMAYDNDFHAHHQYIYPSLDTFLTLNQNDVFKVISTYFNKPLQVMIDSSQKEVIKILNQVGFKLKRSCYERTFDIKSLIPKNNQTVALKSFEQGQAIYDKACVDAFNHYTKTHQDASPLTATLNQFKEVLPTQVVCQMLDDNILNFAFIEEDELCYFGSHDAKQFEPFSYTLIQKMFETYQTITFEVDSTDALGMQFKSLFKDVQTDTFQTYIYTSMGC